MNHPGYVHGHDAHSGTHDSARTERARFSANRCKPRCAAHQRDNAAWQRGPAWCVHPFGLWEDPDDDERARQWANALRADLQPWASGDVYRNFIGDEGHDRVVAGFGQETYGRLAAIKAQYDPDNVFHHNHNVLPGRSAQATPAPPTVLQPS